MKHAASRTISRLLIIVSTSFAISCIQQLSPSEVNPETTGMESLIVPDGFDFDMYQSTPVTVGFSTNGRMTGSTQLQYAIIGLDRTDQVHALQAGYLDLSKGLNTNINKPLHIEQLLLYTKYDGNAQFFEFGSEQLNLSAADLIVADTYFESTNGRVQSVPACTSFLGNATKIICNDNEIVIKSSASFLYVDILLINEQVVRVSPEESGSLNNNGNQWTFHGQVLDYPLDQIKTFTVYANCQTAPHLVGTELVTFINPCLSSSTDTDNDGVTDQYDVRPSDATISSVAYYPARDRYATFAFEDMWPYKGDYDFNDLVVSHQATVYTNASDFVTKVDYQLVIRAIGAKFNNDLCVSFSDPNHLLSFEAFEPSHVTYELVTLDGQTEIRFSEFKNLFTQDGFINTDTTKAFHEPITINMKLLFSGDILNSDFAIDEYLRINQETGREVHKPGKTPTSLADPSLFGFAADDTRPAEGKYFKTIDNLPWVLEIPVEWEYPKEKRDITEGYPHFADFAQGKSNTPWYTDEEGNKIHKHLYKANKK
jgi:LruC domain-containing protein